MAKQAVSLEAAQSAIRASVSRALAIGIIGGFDEAAENGRPLTQVQMIDVMTMGVMAYSEAIDACEGLVIEMKLKNEN